MKKLVTASIIAIEMIIYIRNACDATFSIDPMNPPGDVIADNGPMFAFVRRLIIYAPTKAVAITLQHSGSSVKVKNVIRSLVLNFIDVFFFFMSSPCLSLSKYMITPVIS